MELEASGSHIQKLSVIPNFEASGVIVNLSTTKSDWETCRVLVLLFVSQSSNGRHHRQSLQRRQFLQKRH
ncbi:hypothetical protein J0J30_23705, partial [Vibrio vulnificus]|nr:hypothetical protein [Vibrio vulnificus]